MPEPEAKRANTSAAKPVYRSDGAELHVSADKCTPSEPSVPIRGRKNLVYSSKEEMPEFIGAPSADNFPLMVTTPKGDAAPVAAFATAARELLKDVAEEGGVGAAVAPREEDIDVAAVGLEAAEGAARDRLHRRRVDA